jgi:hypothetical protein
MIRDYVSVKVLEEMIEDRVELFKLTRSAEHRAKLVDVLADYVEVTGKVHPEERQL